MRFGHIGAALYERRLAGLLIAVALLLMALSIAIRPAPQLATLAAEASAARLRLDNQALFEGTVPLKPGGFVVGQLTSASVNGRTADATGVLEVLRNPTAVKLSLERLSVSGGSELALVERADCVTFALAAGAAEADLIVGAGASETSVTVRMSGSDSGASEFGLCPVDAADPLEFILYGVSEIAFEKRFQPNSMQSAMVSSLTAATLSFPAIGTENAVVPLEGLHLRSLDTSRPLLVRFGPETLRLSYVGRVGDAATDALGTQRSLMPRLIDHLIGRSPVAALLAAFGFFWSLLWGLLAFWRSSSKR